LVCIQSFGELAAVGQQHAELIVGIGQVILPLRVAWIGGSEPRHDRERLAKRCDALFAASEPL
jgi:hypothetical protein